MPISSRQNRGVDFYCRFLPAKIEEPISIADFFPLKSRTRFLLPISNFFAATSASALRSYSYRLSFTIIIHYSTHHGRKNSIICSWQLGAAHLCWWRILCAPLRHYAAPAPISMITTTHHSCALAAGGGGSTSTAVSHTRCIDFFRGIFADVSFTPSWVQLVST